MSTTTRRRPRALPAFDETIPKEKRRCMRIMLADECNDAELGLPRAVAADECANSGGGQLKVSRDVLALVLPLIAPLIYLEDIWTMMRAFPLYRDMIEEVAAKTFRHLTVSACDRFIAPTPPLNFAKHVCRCPAEQRFKPLLDASKFPHLRTLIAIRTWAHPVLSSGMNELASFKSLARLYIAPTKGSTQSNWWYSLPLTLTDLCIFFNARMPCNMRLNHLVNVTNCFISANTMGTESAANSALAHLPPNLACFKISRRALEYTQGHLDDDALQNLPQSITWLECDSLEGELRHLPRSLVHLKCAIFMYLKATVFAHDDNHLSAEAYMARHAPPNWTSFATECDAACNTRLEFTYPDNSLQHPMAVDLIYLPKICDWNVGSFPLKQHGTDKFRDVALPHIKVWRWPIDIDSCEQPDLLISRAPNVTYIDASVGLSAIYALTFSPFKHLRYLHLVYSSTVFDLSKVTFPDSLIHLTLCICDKYAGMPQMPSRLETMNVVVQSKRVGALMFHGAAPASLRGIDFCIYHGSSTDTFDSFVKRVTGLVRTCMSTYRTLDDDQRLVPFTISARQAGSAVVSSMVDVSRAMAQRSAGLVDYSSAWGWQMDRIDRLRL